MVAAHREAPPMVRLTITQLNPSRSGEVAVLLEVAGPEWGIQETARAWAAVRGFHTLVADIDHVNTDPAPASGLRVVTDQPHNLLVLTRWPWYPHPDP